MIDIGLVTQMLLLPLKVALSLCSANFKVSSRVKPMCLRCVTVKMTEPLNLTCSTRLTGKDDLLVLFCGVSIEPHFH